MTLLEKIKAAHGERFKELDVPEWGVTVRAQLLTIPQYVELYAGNEATEAGAFGFYARLVEMSLVDPLIDASSRYLLTEGRGLVVTPRLGQALMEWNGIGTNAENPEKNSESIQSNSLPTDSADRLDASTPTISTST